MQTVALYVSTGRFVPAEGDGSGRNRRSISRRLAETRNEEDRS